MSKTALVTGATGFVGSRLCRELTENRYSVKAMVRKNSRLTNIMGLEMETVEAELTDTESLKKAVEGVDVVFHIAALYREAKFPDSVYWQVNLDGTKHLLEAAKSAGVKKFIYCSTIGVHSHIKNPPADETEPYAPTDVYQESKTEAEKYVLTKFRENYIQGCVIRPAMIWGPNDTRFLKFFKGISKRKLPLIGGGEILCHWILVDDLVRAFRFAAESEKSNGQVYIIAGERPVTLKYTMQKIAENLKVKLLPFRIPVLPIQIAGSIVETICKPFGIEPPLHRRRADFFTKNRAFNTSKAASELGFKPSHTFEDEVKLVSNWYKENGWLK
jgi:nucleoside-diphosphate-sugar epimerase